MRLLAHAAALAGLAHSVQAYYLPGIEPRAYLKVRVKQNMGLCQFIVAGTFPALLLAQQLLFESFFFTRGYI